MPAIMSNSFQAVLSRQPMFRDLSSQELDMLAAGTEECRFLRQKSLFQKGDVPLGMHIVIMGQVKIFLLSAQGGEKVVHMAGPGATFGEALAFLDKPYPVNAVATQDSIALLIRKEVLLRAMEESPMLARKMLANLSMRLHELIEDMEICSMRSSLQRVICFLSNQSTSGEAGKQLVHLGTSKQTIASQLNLTPETFSRSLNQLSAAGLIEVSGRDIQVLDREKMMMFTG